MGPRVPPYGHASPPGCFRLPSGEGEMKGGGGAGARAKGRAGEPERAWQPWTEPRLEEASAVTSCFFC